MATINISNNSIVTANNLTLTGNSVSMIIGAGGDVQLKSGVTVNSSRFRNVTRFCEYSGGRGNCAYAHYMGYITSAGTNRFCGAGNSSRVQSSTYAPGIAVPAPPSIASPFVKSYVLTTAILNLTSNGVVCVSGANTDGRLVPTTTLSGSNVNPPEVCKVNNVASIATASHDGNTIYYLTSDGKLYSAGDNSYGQLVNGGTTATGNGSAHLAWNPDDHSGVTVSKVVARGSADTVSVCILLSNGTVRTAGYGGNRQMGDATTGTQNTAWRNVASFVDTTDIQCGGDSSNTTFYALIPIGDGYLWGWGRNAYSTINNTTTPINSLGTPISYNASKFWVHGVRERLFMKSSLDGKIYARGSNTYGELGITGGNNPVTSFTLVPGLADYDVVQLVGVEDYSGIAAWTMAYTSDGKILATGFNGNGCLSLGTTTNVSNFQLIYGGLNSGNIPLKTITDNEPYIWMSHISGNQYGTFFLDREGYVHYAGTCSDTAGRLGDNVTAGDASQRTETLMAFYN